MELKLAKSNREFKELYKDLFREYEVELQFFYVNLLDDNQIIDLSHIRGGVYNDDGELLLLFLDANPHKLQLFGLNNSLEASKCLVDFIIENNIKITGILGSSIDVELFRQVYPGKLTIGMQMDVMKLVKLNSIPRSGRIVNPTTDDLEFIATGIMNFSNEALNEKADYDKILERSKLFVSDPNFYIYENTEGVKTSFAHVRKRGEKGVSISAVYTYEQYRGKGYAKSMINLVCELVLKEASYVSLFVDKKNPISNKVYKDNGFEIIRDMIEYNTEV